MYKALLIFLLTLCSARLIAGDSGTKSSVDRPVAKPTSTIFYMDSIYVTRPHLALKMLDSLRCWSDENGYQAPATRSYVNMVTCLACMVAGQMRPARHYGQETVAAARAEDNPQSELMAISQLCDINHYLGDEEALGYWAQELEKRNAETLQSAWYEAYSSLFYAKALRMRGEFLSAWQHLEKRIQSLDQLGEWRASMEVEIIPLAAALLGEMKRPDEAIALLEQSIALLEQPVHSAGQPGTSQRMDEQGRALALMVYYECLMNQYLATGRVRQADHYYRLHQELSARFSGLERDDYYPGKYLMQAHRYPEAETYARNSLDGLLQHSDSISEATKNCMLLLADACLAQGKKAEAATLYRRALMVSDSLAVRSRKQAYVEYSLMSKLDNYKDTIRQQESELQRHQVTLMFSGVVAFLVLVLIVLGVRQMRRQRRFNCELREENRLKQQAEDELMHLKEVMQNRALPADLAPAEAAPIDIAVSLEELDEWLIEENRFTQPDMDIEKAARHCGVTKRELAERCMKYKEKSFNEYLADLRLDYSCRRLMDEDFPTIETVAQESGFAVSTFLRRFKTKYGMSPTDWRNLKAVISD